MKRWEYRLDEMTKHHWAFYYYCRRLGDSCYVDHGKGLVIIEVEDE